MSVTNKSLSKWQKAAGIGMVCGLVLAGCDRSEKETVEVEDAESVEQQPVTDENAAATSVGCNDSMVQDRLKTALKNTLNQQAQTLAANYANTAEVSLSGGMVSDKVNNIKVDIQNVAVLQEANANGMTTCQASVSMTLPSEDLYQASQAHAANNKPSLQTRAAQDNIRINNNMLVDDAFTYVAGTQAGQVQARIAGQPALIAIVADVMAGSAFQAVMEEAQEERQAAEARRRAQEAARRREAAQEAREEQASRQPSAVTPAEPARPAEPATPPTTSQSNSPANNQAASTPSANAEAPTISALPKVAPEDDSIDMVIIEDESATY
ncbi:hypothetical protein J3492_11925 [Psychrobacter sp. F1192]|uniref:Lipoprotein n=1 Tax=Psychrobacter coccoides TaxID=2818440 RepID=A0ABS3NR63_9GAMM|nr:hypothetical protein [Psychrobacter coccoides]MBO1531912.1 hypothetical protein [Psychrobacter coccoides]